MADEPTQVQVNTPAAQITVTTDGPATVDVAAHEQKTTIHLLEHVQEHPPRDGDPHYHLFNELKRRLERQGLMKCAIPDCTFPGPMEIHHSLVEFSEQNGVDLARFNAAYGLHLVDDGAFKDFIEGPGNCEVLCPTHHRTHLGVHVLPGPFWEALRVWKAGLPPPAEVVTADGA